MPDAHSAESPHDYPGWFEQFIDDRQVRKLSPHSLKAYRQDFAAAAAIVSGLAAFGPGGMVGGLAMLGGLASTGAMVTTVAATAGGGSQPLLTDPTSVAIHVAIAHALKSIDEPYDETLWYRLTTAETEIGAELNRLSAFSDEKAASVQRLLAALAIIDRLMVFMLAKGLTPPALTANSGS